MNIWTDEDVGPNPYLTGGYVVTTGLASVVWFDVRLNVAGANLGQSLFDVALNTPGAGDVTITVKQNMFDRQTTIGSPINLPAGIASPAVSGSSYDTGTHVHGMDHTHGISPASTTPANQTGLTLAVALQPAVTSHTHTLQMPTFVANVVAETAHVHTFNSIYQHQHALTNTATDLALAEIANGTDLSATVLDYVAGDA